jgi:hypothetical protein
VLDHYLTLESGEVIYVPLRVLADGSNSEVVFTLRRRPGMTDEELRADGDAVAADLARLKRILEELAARAQMAGGSKSGSSRRPAAATTVSGKSGP